jgi:hypothetical protein
LRIAKINADFGRQRKVTTIRKSLSLLQDKVLHRPVETTPQKRTSQKRERVSAKDQKQKSGGLFDHLVGVRK